MHRFTNNCSSKTTRIGYAQLNDGQCIYQNTFQREEAVRRGVINPYPVINQFPDPSSSKSIHLQQIQDEIKNKNTRIVYLQQNLATADRRFNEVAEDMRTVKDENRSLKNEVTRLQKKITELTNLIPNCQHNTIDSKTMDAIIEVVKQDVREQEAENNRQLKQEIMSLRTNLRREQEAHKDVSDNLQLQIKQLTNENMTYQLLLNETVEERRPPLLPPLPVLRRENDL